MNAEANTGRHGENVRRAERFERTGDEARNYCFAIGPVLRKARSDKRRQNARHRFHDETFSRCLRYPTGRFKETGAMRKLFLGLLSLGAVTIAVPAQSQVYLDTGSRGVEVGVGPSYGRYRDRGEDWRFRHRRQAFGAYDSYGGGCRVVRERIETPSGRVIIKTRRSC
jgi:hypothetical protein